MVSDPRASRSKVRRFIERPNIIEAIQWFNGVQLPPDFGEYYSVSQIPNEWRARVESLLCIDDLTLHIIDWSVPDDNAMCWFLANDGFNAIVKVGQWISRERNGWYIYAEDVLPKLYEPLDQTALGNDVSISNERSEGGSKRWIASK